MSNSDAFDFAGFETHKVATETSKSFRTILSIPQFMSGRKLAKRLKMNAMNAIAYLQAQVDIDSNAEKETEVSCEMHAISMRP